MDITFGGKEYFVSEHTGGTREVAYVYEIGAFGKMVAAVTIYHDEEKVEVDYEFLDNIELDYTKIATAGESALVKGVMMALQTYTEEAA